jgi:hypothetical protein
MSPARSIIPGRDKPSPVRVLFINGRVMSGGFSLMGV